jgi:hypothetical protein
MGDGLGRVALDNSRHQAYPVAILGQHRHTAGYLTAYGVNPTAHQQLLLEYWCGHGSRLSITVGR